MSIKFVDQSQPANHYISLKTNTVLPLMLLGWQVTVCDPMWQVITIDLRWESHTHL